ncbi:hypothetical protein CEXT_501021 [Caerostris extrusa]|uniref:Uncharacterized protein n=1 Tax=Caerostris extrusa TaxID=172846 RepID=A0AAV4M3H1_CAEEX|nr:hypothetical protein CEXT_501021 [Caerostris extrusa]
MRVEKNVRTSLETKRASSSTKARLSIESNCSDCWSELQRNYQLRTVASYCAILCTEILLAQGKGIIGLSRREIILHLPSFNASRKVIFIQETTSFVLVDDAKDNLSRRRIECSSKIGRICVSIF